MVSGCHLLPSASHADGIFPAVRFQHLDTPLRVVAPCAAMRLLPHARDSREPPGTVERNLFGFGAERGGPIQTPIARLAVRLTCRVAAETFEQA